MKKLIYLFLALLIVACSDDDLIMEPQEIVTIQGTVLHGESPIENSTVTFYHAGSTQGAVAVSLGETQTNNTGVFEFSLSIPVGSKEVFYMTAAGPSAPIKLASVIGTQPFPSQFVINERTTIATAYAMAQFINGDNIAGSYPGLQNAAATSQNLVNIMDGNIAPVLNQTPNGPETETLKKFNSLSNIIAACLEQPSECPNLFAISKSPENDLPDNTLQAAINIAHTPWRQENVSLLYNFSLNLDLYEPILESNPDNWTLALRYFGNGQQLDGPGNIAFDKDGNAWVSNNYSYGSSTSSQVCGDTNLLRFTPTGEAFPGSPYQGGGVYGAGFGVTIDNGGDVWVGNFGFKGDECPSPLGDDDTAPLLRSTVSHFNSDGIAISPDGDFYADPVITGGYPLVPALTKAAWPQGMATDEQGNIWVANCYAGNVTKFINGDPNQRIIYDDIDLEIAFDITIDPLGNAWVTSNYNSSVCIIDTEGNTQLLNNAGLTKPMGIASDSQGNIWVANSGVVTLPCGGYNTAQDLIEFIIGIAENEPATGASVTMISQGGTMATTYNGGVYMPWGISVDGDDNVFVANFNGKRLSHIAGANLSSLPPGFNTGDPIAPNGGYAFDGFVRSTGAQVDPSGNVWVTNNWDMVPDQTNPGGHHLVVFIGLASPVKTPLIGAPKRP